mmetsp:Transcript_72069/g.182268  ORF Transcript_72069/g.182268 Transcript_72069/m.182268 type:complete len:615 (-) Transcript_72069:13-1857(-)
MVVPSSGATLLQCAMESREELAGDFKYHYCFNRMLPGHAKAVAGLAFCREGGWLVSADGSGDLRVWDARAWAEAAKLKGDHKEPLLGLALSPSARPWLVAARPSALSIFASGGRWPLECSLPVMVNPESGEASAWRCIAFSPAAVEVDHECGAAGHGNEFAAVSTTHLCLLDYSNGWSPDMARRTHSVLRYSRVTCMAFMPCGSWILTGHECGHVLVWNAFSLTLDRKLSAHVGAVSSLAVSPKGARYSAHFASGGMDLSICLWKGATWTAEQSTFDTKSAVDERAEQNLSDQGARAGVSSLAFSSCGTWLLSATKELCVWRVACPAPPSGPLALQLHERVAPVGTAEAVRAATFCNDDAVILGTLDGLLNLWLKRRGAPERSLPQPPTSPANRRTRSAEGGPKPAALERLPRPLNRVVPEDPLKARPPSRPVQVETVVRPLTESPLPILRTGSRNPSPEVQLDPDHVRRPQSRAKYDSEGSPRRRLPKPASASSLPGVGGLWKVRNFELSDLYTGSMMGRGAVPVPLHASSAELGHGGRTSSKQTLSTTSLPSALDNSTAWRSASGDVSPHSKAGCGELVLRRRHSRSGLSSERERGSGGHGRRNLNRPLSLA